MLQDSSLLYMEFTSSKDADRVCSVKRRGFQVNQNEYLPIKFRIYIYLSHRRWVAECVLMMHT